MAGGDWNIPRETPDAMIIDSGDSSDPKASDVVELTRYFRQVAS
jgi:hypothetical protein